MALTLRFLTFGLLFTTGFLVNGQTELALMKAQNSIREFQNFRTLLTEEVQNEIEVFFAHPNKFHRSGASFPGWLTSLLKWLEYEAAQVSSVLTSPCAKDLETLLRSLDAAALGHKNRTWAFQFLDASGKVGSGFLEGNLQVIGSFAECLDIGSDPASLLKSRYCTSMIRINGSAVLSVGTCVPAQCTTNDITMLSQFLLNQTKSRMKPLKSLNLVQVQCDSNEDEVHFSGPAIVAIVILAVFGFLLAAGTLVDAVLRSLAKLEAESSSANPTLIKSIEKNSVLIRLFLCWSALRNGHKILSVASPRKAAAVHPGDSSSPPPIHSLHGIRFVSMCWIIMCHTLALSYASLKDPLRLADDGGQWWFQWIANATFSVDTFFFLSGLLLAYVVTAQAEHHRRINWIQYYVHRYWRLTPPYMLCFAVFAGLFKYIAWGPLWYPDNYFPNQCAVSWWSNLLYVNNFFYVNDINGCMPWSWYLANDMQFYAISPLFIIPFLRRKTLGIAAWTVLMLVYIAGTIATTVVYRLPASMVGEVVQMDNPQLHLDYFAYYYVKPWTRIGPYLVGVAFGYLLYQAKTKNWRLKPWQTAVGWPLAFAASAAIIFPLIDENAGRQQTNLVAATFYNVLSRPIWGVIVGFVILACETGSGGFINTVLSFPGFVPLSRLSYCAYLVSPAIQCWFYDAMTAQINYSKLTMFILALGFIVASYCAAFLTSLLFESPALGLERLLTSLISGERRPAENSVGNAKVQKNSTIVHNSENVGVVDVQSTAGANEPNANISSQHH